MSGITFYTTGTLSLVNGSAAAVGSGTIWTGLTDGDLLVGPDGELYELVFTDDTHATLDRNYTGSNVSGSAYVIMRVSAARDSIGDASRKLSGVASIYRAIANFTAADQYLKLSQATTDDKAGLLLQTDGVDKIRMGLMTTGNFEVQWLNDGVWTTAIQLTPVGVVSIANFIAPISQRLIDASGDVTISDDESADEIEINNTSGGPITVYLPDVTVRAKPITITDVGINAESKPITVSRKNASSQTVMGGTQYVIDSNGGGIKLTSNSAKTGWK